MSSNMHEAGVNIVEGWIDADDNVEAQTQDKMEAMAKTLVLLSQKHKLTPRLRLNQATSKTQRRPKPQPILRPRQGALMLRLQPKTQT